MRTWGGNELGCSNSGSGVSDVQAIELIKPFTSMSKISDRKQILGNSENIQQSIRKTKAKLFTCIDKIMAKVSLTLIICVTKEF